MTPELRKFIELRSSTFDDLTIQYTQGAPATLTLTDDAGNRVVEPIHGWTSDEIETFVASKLRP